STSNRAIMTPPNSRCQCIWGLARYSASPWCPGCRAPAPQSSAPCCLAPTRGPPPNSRFGWRCRPWSAHSRSRPLKIAVSLPAAIPSSLPSALPSRSSAAGSWSKHCSAMSPVMALRCLPGGGSWSAHWVYLPCSLACEAHPAAVKITLARGGVWTASKGSPMAKKQSAESVYRIVDVVGVSEKSWEDAGRRAIETAATSLRDLRVAEVTQMDMKVEDGKVTAFRTRVALSFKYEG